MREYQVCSRFRVKGSSGAYSAAFMSEARQPVFKLLRRRPLARRRLAVIDPLPAGRLRHKIQVMWSGEVTFGEGWAVYAGKAVDQHPHAHAALQIAIAEAGLLTVSVAAEAFQDEAVLIAPLTRHKLSANGEVVALIYLDAATPLARRLAGSMLPKTAGPVPEPLRTALGRDPKRMPSVLEALAQLDSGTETHDPRLSDALASLTADRHPGAVARAALAAGLSAGRLRALARTQLHMPLSQWILWQKLGRASRAIAAGQGLAEAAITGGFADQAHLNRIMRRMFGVTPGAAAIPLRGLRANQAS